MKTTISEVDSLHAFVEQQERLHAFRAAHPREQIVISGTTWSYILAGQGSETILLLPGGERIGDLAFPIVQQFELEYRCLYPSYPPYSTMGELVDGLAALLRKLSIEKVILFAASFGGDVGQCFVRKYPDRVSKLILLNTGIPDKRLGKATQRSKPFVTLLPMGIVRLLLQKILVRVLSVRPEERLFWQEMLHELIAQLTRADILSSFDETIDYRLNYQFTPDELASWMGKILILQSEDDPATKLAMRQALRNLYPQARVHTFQNAGHTPFLSQPEEFYPLVNSFLHES